MVRRKKTLKNQGFGGGAGIRTLDASFSSHTPLAGEPLQPLGHASGLPNTSTSRSLSRGRGLKIKRLVQRPDSKLHVLVLDQNGGFDLTGTDHLNVDVLFGQGFEHQCRDACV